MTNEKREKNFSLYIQQLEKLNLPTDVLVERYGEAIKNASFTVSNEFGNAYEGSFLEITLRKLTPYALKINEILPPEKQVDKNTLIKVCLLHQIAKAVRLIPNDNAWEIEKRNMVFKYAPDQPSIRTGLHSLMMCQECQIPISLEEAEALTINDRDLTDDQSRWHASIMATIVRQANELTYLEINQKN